MGPGSGQPDRRAHRLQRRVRAAAGPAAAASRPRPGWPRARCCGPVRCASGRPSSSRWPRSPPGRWTAGSAYVAGVAWALREAGHDVPGLDVVVDGDVPVGAGLSSSAALECAVAVGLERPRWAGAVPRRAGRGRPARGERRGRRPDRRDGPDGLAARTGRPPGVHRHPQPGRRARAVRPGRRPACAAGDRHQGAARAGRRRVRRAPRGPASRPPRPLGVPALRDVPRRPRRRAGPAGRTRPPAAPAGPARRHRERAGAGRRRGAAAGRTAPVGPAARRLARLDARRLRDHRARGGPRGRGRAGGRCATAPG